MSEARFGRIVLGYFGSFFILFLALVGSLWLLGNLRINFGELPHRESAWDLLFEVASISLYTFFLAWIPWSPFIAVAEILRLRHWSYHVLMGSTVWLALFWYLDGGSPSPPGAEFVSHPYLNQGVLAYGAVAGLLYWLIAGRTSGSARAATESAAGQDA